MHRLAWVLLLGCTATPRLTPVPTGAAPTDPCAGSVTLIGWQDLPREDERSHGLSALVWDEAARVLYAVGDKVHAIHRLLPDDATFAHFHFGESLSVDLGEDWDVEGMAMAGGRFYLGNESGPCVHAVGLDGTVLGEVALPESFRRSRHNHGLESLVATADGKTLIVANEHAFTDDGEEADATRGTTVRITRIDLATGAATQQRYTTDPVFVDDPRGRTGVVDIMAPSAETLYVTERAYAPGHGNSVRMYCVSDARDKRLMLDLAGLAASGLPEPFGPQRNPLLENFEGFTLGPTLPDGRRLIFGVSDDNISTRQRPRLLILALTPR